MKLAILTLPLHLNYGGILQAYALQETLIRMGHEVYLVNLPLPKVRKPDLLKEYAKRFVKKYFLSQPISLRGWPSENEYRTIAQNINPFIQQHLKLVQCYSDEDILNWCLTEKIEGFIVGSDQVWRPSYSSFISSFFLEFLGELKLKRISYAASFGLDIWPFSLTDTHRFGEILKCFNAVSVREDTAVLLCDKYWNINAELVLDPTLLLTSSDYIHLSSKQDLQLNEILTAYILDMSEEKKEMMDSLSKYTGLQVHYAMAKEKYWTAGAPHLQDCILPSIEYWLYSILNADFVVTDSFHGMVFSILFNKQFICIGNKGRGVSRFTSLLKWMSLEDRLIYSVNDLDMNILLKKIDYGRVNELLNSAKERSMNFLQHALS